MKRTITIDKENVEYLYGGTHVKIIEEKLIEETEDKYRYIVIKQIYFYEWEHRMAYSYALC